MNEERSQIRMKQKEKSSYTKNCYLIAVAFLCAMLVFYTSFEYIFEEVLSQKIKGFWEQETEETIQTTVVDIETTSEAEMAPTIEQEVVTKEEPEEPTEVQTEPDPSLSKPRLPETLTQLEIYQRGMIHIPRVMLLDIPVVRQYPQLPTGCESVALTMALKYMGFELEKTTIAKDYLVRSGFNYGGGYVGNPFSENGAGIFAPGLALTANIYLQEQGAEWEAKDISGVPFEKLYEYVAAGYPVVLWTTMYFGTPEFSGESCQYGGRTFYWYNNEHCVVLGGYDLEKERVTIYDPLQGKVTVKAKTIQNIYEKTGANALVICEGTY